MTYVTSTMKESAHGWRPRLAPHLLRRQGRACGLVLGSHPTGCPRHGISIHEGGGMSLAQFAPGRPTLWERLKRWWYSLRLE
jgi:hypothetical protein